MKTYMKLGICFTKFGERISMSFWNIFGRFFVSDTGERVKIEAVNRVNEWFWIWS